MDVDETAGKLFQRWGYTSRPMVTCKDDLGHLLGVAIGLHALFNDDLAAEKQWLHAHHSALRGKPYTRLLESRFHEVHDAINRDRNL